jgi:hypothetical protein
VAQRRLTPSEIKLLREALSADYKAGNIRLREGEYQFILARAITSFQLELHFPDVRDIIRRLYGEEKAIDIQFVRKIQTILKKMEKSNIVQILPKKRPWDLQRYALTSFKFQDVDKNLVIFATDDQVRQARDMLRSILNHQAPPIVKLDRVKISVLALILVAFYSTSVWALTQYVINPIIFVLAFSVAIVFSVMLGKALSQGQGERELN